MDSDLWSTEEQDQQDTSHGDIPSPTPEQNEGGEDEEETGDLLRDYRSPDFALPGARRSPTGGPRQLRRRVRPPVRLRDYVP